MLHNAFKTIHSDDIFSRYVTTAANLNQAVYLLLDNALWLNSIEVIHLKKKAKILEYSNKFWLFSTFLNLFRDLSNLLMIFHNNETMQDPDPLQNYTINKNPGTRSNSKPSKSLIKTNIERFFIKILKVIAILYFNKQYQSLLLDTLRNIFDILLPLSNLKYINISPGIEGFCGFISSIIGLIILWDTKPKLKI